MKRYPAEQINKAETYVYFNKVNTSLDAMICTNEVILKLKNAKARQHIVSKLNACFDKDLRKLKIIQDTVEDNYNKRWFVPLKKGSCEEVIDLIESLRKIKC